LFSILSFIFLLELKDISELNDVSEPIELNELIIGSCNIVFSISFMLFGKLVVDTVLVLFGKLVIGTVVGKVVGMVCEIGEFVLGRLFNDVALPDVALREVSFDNFLIYLEYQVYQ